MDAVGFNISLVVIYFREVKAHFLFDFYSCSMNTKQRENIEQYIFMV